MRDHHEGARPGVQEVLQLLEGVDVQVVGRLVEQQHVRLGHEHACELQAPPLAAGEVPHRGALPLGGKSEPLRQLRGGQFAFAERDVGGHVLDGVDDAALRIEIVEFLAQPADAGGLPLDPFAGCERVLPCQGAQQRGFAGAVHANQADALARGEPPGEAVDERAPVGGVDARVLELDDYASLPLFGKRHEFHGVARRRHVFDQGFRGLDAVARLGGAGGRAAAQPSQLLAGQVLPALLDRVGLASPLRARERPVVVAALVDVHRPVVDLPGQRGHGVQEPAVVRDHHDGDLARQQVVGEPLHALDVQVVRRLVQHHEVEVLNKRRGEVDAAALTAGQLPDRGVEAQLSHTSALQHLAHLGVGCPFEGLQAQRLDDGLAHRQGAVKRKALRDHRHAQVGGVRDAAAVRRLDAGEHLEQRGLAAAVDADDADALACLHTERDAVQQRFQPPSLRDVFQVDQVSHIGCVVYAGSNACSPRLRCSCATMCAHANASESARWCPSANPGAQYSATVGRRWSARCGSRRLAMRQVQ